MKRTAKQRHGFFLIELLMVLLISGAFFLVAARVFGSMMKLNYAASQAQQGRERPQGEMGFDEGRDEGSGQHNEASAQPREHGPNGGDAANEAANAAREGEGNAQNEAHVPPEATPRETRERNRARR